MLVGGFEMYRILVCDDEKDIVSALKIYLMAEGYEVFEANNGKQALQIIQEQEIHLILMDLMMPVMDGITATAKLREVSNIPIIMLTAKSEDGLICCRDAACCVSSPQNGNLELQHKLFPL